MYVEGPRSASFCKEMMGSSLLVLRHNPPYSPAVDVESSYSLVEALRSMRR